MINEIDNLGSKIIEEPAPTKRVEELRKTPPLDDVLSSYSTMTKIEPMTKVVVPTTIKPKANLKINYTAVALANAKRAFQLIYKPDTTANDWNEANNLWEIILQDYLNQPKSDDDNTPLIDIYIMNSEKVNLLSYALKSKNKDVIEAFIAAVKHPGVLEAMTKRCVDKKRIEILSVLVEQEKIQGATLRSAINCIKVHDQDKKTKQALFDAARIHRNKIALTPASIESLVASEAEKNRWEIILFFINIKLIDINAVFCGTTLLDYAMECMNFEKHQLLLKLGATTHLNQDQENQAQDQKLKEITKELNALKVSSQQSASGSLGRRRPPSPLMLSSINSKENCTYKDPQSEKSGDLSVTKVRRSNSSLW